MNRSSGVLLNISSLPGEFGIGDFNNAARYFVQSFLDMGFHWWQVLPITTIGDGNSPYSGISLKAGNYLYIDPYGLMNEGLINQEELEYIKYRDTPYLVNYEHARWAKNHVLRLAYTRFKEQEALDAFIKENNWLIDYALFMCLKEDYKGLCWSEWDRAYKYREEAAIDDYVIKNSDRLYYYYFEQYIFFKQWFAVKNAANEIGLGIIGDIPVYPCYDSVEVWSNPSEYQLDEDLSMKKVAGVPPDYFAEEGQLWRNPLYDYSVMENNGYKTLKDRFRYALRLYDMLRIDHFRGFYQYWAVPAGADSAKDGAWYDGPGIELFRGLMDEPIIAEDLGCIDEGVRAFLKECGFPGMKVMQFGFMDDDSAHLPHYYQENCIAFTGTHDNDTTLGWIYKLPEDKRNYVLHYCGADQAGWGAGGGDCPSTKAFIKTLIMSSAGLAVVAFQDLCGYGSDTRMNVPGKADGNWRYRATYGALSSLNAQYLLDLNNTYGRNRPFIKK
jgi:4-alpha-glucanotransferase